MASTRSVDFYSKPTEVDSSSKYDTLKLPPSPTPSNNRTLQLHLRPVTSESDVPTLATINDRALDADPQFKRWMNLFTERTEYSTTVSAVTEALTDPEYRLVKAVVVDDTDADMGGDNTARNHEKIVGFIHWFCGFIQIEKMDPFAEKPPPSAKSESADVKDVASSVAENLGSEAARLEKKRKDDDDDQETIDRARRLRKGELKYIETRNHYIGTIRGRKHMFVRRIMVLPEYQGKGVGSKLMKVVTDEADRLGIPCWLFARPAGMPLYRRVGYQTVDVTVMSDAEEGFESADTHSMIRLPRPVPVAQ